MGILISYSNKRILVSLFMVFLYFIDYFKAVELFFLFLHIVSVSYFGNYFLS